MLVPVGPENKGRACCTPPPDLDASFLQINDAASTRETHFELIDRQQKRGGRAHYSAGGGWTVSSGERSDPLKDET